MKRLILAGGGHAHLDAYLEDYAYVAEGLLDLYEAGAPERYLHAAAELAVEGQYGQMATILRRRGSIYGVHYAGVRKNTGGVEG